MAKQNLIGVQTERRPRPLQDCRQLRRVIHCGDMAPLVEHMPLPKVMPGIMLNQRYSP